MKLAPVRSLFALMLAIGLLLVAPRANAGDIASGLRFVPHDSFFVAGVDGDKLRRSPLFETFVKKLTGRRAAKRGLEKLEADTGFHPMKHIRSLVVALPTQFLQDDDNFVIIAEARVSERRLVKFLKAQTRDRVKEASSASGRHYLLGRKGDGFLAFRGRHVIIGSSTLLRSVMSRRGPSPAIATAVRSLRGHHSAAVMRVPKDLRTKLAKEDPALGQLTLLTAAIDAPGSVQADLVAQFSTPRAALDVQAMLEQKVAAAIKELQPGFDPKQHLQLQQMGPSLRASLSVPAAQASELLERLLTSL